LPRDRRWLLLSWLFVDRIVYTLNWLAISPAQPFLATEFNIGLSALGILGAVFLLGVALFQLPAAILAARYGAKKIALLGLFLSSFFAGLCGLAPAFEYLLVLRFLTGVFLSFFFGPGITFFTPLFNTRERGTAVGVYNAGFHTGTLVTLGVWPTIMSLYGWRLGLLVPGVAGVLLAFATYWVSRWVEDPVDPRGVHVSTIGNRLVLYSALGLGFAGAAWYPLTQFGILYLTSEAKLDVGIAGAMVSVLSLGSVVGAPLSGRLYDRARDRKRLLYLLNLLNSVSLAAFSISPVQAIIPIVFMTGLFYTASNNLYYVTPMMVVSQSEIAVTVATVNMVHLLAASAIPYVFSAVAESWGYFAGWMMMVFVSLLAVLCVWRMRF